MLTQDLLKKLIKYDPLTGEFSWTISRNGVSKWSRVGYLNTLGYVVISVLRSKYFAHRLAWLYVYGYFPENHIDHINRNRSDNRIENLRVVSQQCNIRNTGNNIKNTSGVKGVSWRKDRNTWRVFLKINNKYTHVCVAKDFAEAVCCRLAVEQCLDWEGCDSSSPAYQYVTKHIQNKK